MLRRRYFQRTVLRNDRRFESAKARSGIDAEFVGKQRPRTAVGAEGLALPTGAIQRQHQLAPTPFTQWRVGHRSLEFADDLGDAACGQQRIGPVLHQRGMAFEPPRLLRRPPASVRQFWNTAPES